MRLTGRTWEGREPMSLTVRLDVEALVPANCQITAFKEAYSGNNRPIQSTAGRSVLIDCDTNDG